MWLCGARRRGRCRVSCRGHRSCRTGAGGRRCGNGELSRCGRCQHSAKDQAGHAARPHQRRQSSSAPPKPAGPEESGGRDHDRCQTPEQQRARKPGHETEQREQRDGTHPPVARQPTTNTRSGRAELSMINRIGVSTVSDPELPAGRRLRPIRRRLPILPVAPSLTAVPAILVAH